MLRSKLARDWPKFSRKQREQFKKTMWDRFTYYRRVEESGCWIWTGPISGSRGYGHTSFHHYECIAHRLSWFIHNGYRWPRPNIHVAHTCDVRACVNPSHLFLATCSENVLDCVAKKRHVDTKKTHCRHGHQYSAENTYFWMCRGRAVRCCRICHIRVKRAYVQRRKLKEQQCKSSSA